MIGDDDLLPAEAVALGWSDAVVDGDGDTDREIGETDADLATVPDTVDDTELLLVAVLVAEVVTLADKEPLAAAVTDLETLPVRLGMTDADEVMDPVWLGVRLSATDDDVDGDGDGEREPMREAEPVTETLAATLAEAAREELCVRVCDVDEDDEVDGVARVLAVRLPITDGEARDADVDGEREALRVADCDVDGKDVRVTVFVALAVRVAMRERDVDALAAAEIDDDAVLLAVARALRDVDADKLRDNDAEIDSVADTDDERDLDADGNTDLEPLREGDSEADGDAVGRMLCAGDLDADRLRASHRPPQDAGLLVSDTVGESPDDADGLTEVDELADELKRHTAAKAAAELDGEGGKERVDVTDGVNEDAEKSLYTEPAPAPLPPEADN